MKLFNNNKTERILRSLGVLAIVISSFLFLTSCNTTEERVEKVGGVTAQQIIENPSAYVGKTVMVSGDVEEIHGPRAFNMDSGASLGELLVVGREPFPNLPDAGDRAYVINDVATVTGVVRMFAAADVEREIGWDLDPNIESEFNGKPVLVVQKAGFRAGAGANTRTSVNPNANQSGVGDEITDVTIITVVSEADRVPLVGKRVKFDTVKVLSVVGDRTFYVGPNANQRVLVVLEEEATPNTATEGKVDVNAGQTVSFNGNVMKMPTVDEANQRFGKLMNKSELNNLKNQQVYIRTDKVNILGK